MPDTLWGARDPIYVAGRARSCTPWSVTYFRVLGNCRVRCRPVRSTIRRAGSGSASAPPQTEVRRPPNLMLREVTPPALALDTSARPHGRGTATPAAPGVFSAAAEGSQWLVHSAPTV
ncbi:hypothetical protein NDU88_004353 [Pleurodeles waltl]|uniref:Uncharacterized protein n=1 Tax=Pleurodeles waltl TaxID=8319 RepID=A0AAV7KXH6_PLEWA|nr:hypothetical protein NDU88_004353 [Pleurodeles waltl]